MYPNRLLWADLLRISAIFAMVVLHVAAAEWNTAAMHSTEWQIMNIYDSAARWCVPVLIMLSGMLFLNPKKEVSTTQLFKKNILRIFLALLFWGIAYQLFKYYRYNVSLTFQTTSAIFYKILFGIPRYHLWFLYTIIGLYLLTPALRIFVANSKKKDIVYVLWLFFIIGTCVPLVNTILKLNQLSYSLNKLLPELTGYAGYYLAGYYFSAYELSKKHKITIYILGVVSVLFTILFTSYISFKTDEKIGALYEYLLPTTLFISFAVFIAFRRFFKTTNLKNNTLITHLSVCTFGIYLTHDFFIQLLSMSGITALSFSPLVSIPVLSVLIFSLSYFFTSIIRTIPIVKKYIT
jgi:surface polysaccharide O-acyltransferase-like enzyme